MSQNVPLGPLDSPHAVRRRRLRPRPPEAHLTLIGIGLALAGLGVWISASPPSITVRRTQSSYRIGGSTLWARGQGTYIGAGGVLVFEDEGEVVRAAASSTLNGAPMVGLCTWTRGSRQERCQFRLGGLRLTAVDSLTASGWDRRYDSGSEVVLETGGAAVPVPFAVDAS
jgi:hypothetical protein